MNLKDIAKEAGVSIVTASRAINGHPSVRENLKKRVLETASRNGYCQNLFARGLVKSSSNVVALYVSKLNNPFFGSIAEKISLKLKSEGFDTMLCVDDDHHKHVFRSFKLAASMLISRADFEILKEISSLGGHIIGVNAYHPPSVSFPNILFDFEPSYIRIAELLLSAGINKISFLSHVPEKFQQRKFGSLRKFLSQTKVKIISSQNSNSFSTVEQFFSFLSLAKEKEIPQVVFCENDILAVELYLQLHSVKSQKFENLKIIGCDGIINLKDIWTVRIDLDNAASTVVEVLKAKINGRKIAKNLLKIKTEAVFN